SSRSCTATRTATRRNTTLPARVVSAAPRTSHGRPHDSHRHHLRRDARRRRRRLYAPPRPTHPRTPLHHTAWTRIQEPTMTKYTADDFKNARFATHPDGKIAARNWDGD